MQWVYVLGVTLGSLYVDTRSMFLHYYRIYIVCLVLELLGSWVVVGFGVGMGAFGWTLIPYVLDSQEFYGFLRFGA